MRALVKAEVGQEAGKKEQQAEGARGMGTENEKPVRST